MKFPGRRHTKHYFPVEERTRVAFSDEVGSPGNIYAVGIDQLLVDIEIPVSDEFLIENKFVKGESFIIDDDLATKIYKYHKERNLISGEFPGGTVGNTLHNFSVLSECPSVTLGTIKEVVYLCR
jgi:inosine kinase